MSERDPLVWDILKKFFALWVFQKTESDPPHFDQIDTVIPMRAHETQGDETQGEGRDPSDCMKQFKAAWKRFADDEANLVKFLNAKRRGCRITNN